MREVQVIVKVGGHPDLSGFDTAMFAICGGEIARSIKVFKIERRLFKQMFLVALDGEVVVGAALGCILLLLRKSAAFYLFIASLLGVIVQMIPYLGKIGSTIDFSPFEILMIVVMTPAVAAFLIWYSKRAESKGWTS